MTNIHLLGLFHTVPNDDYTHCAFTNRIRTFSKMMKPFGYNIIEYSNEGSTTDASEIIEILDKKEFTELKELYKQEQPNSVANIDSTLYRRFAHELNNRIASRIIPGDIVAHPFGIAHSDLLAKFPLAYHVEIGIGYEEAFAPFKVFETNHWQSWHYGKTNTWGSDYNFVCPMGYDLSEWDPSYEQGEYLLYFGRIIDSKGLYIIKEIAKRVDYPVILAGEGDPKPYLDAEIPNLSYIGPVVGKARSELLRKAKAMLMPTRFVEPLGNAGIEGMLCGTPLISCDFGAFAETVQHGITGFRCHTLADYLEAIRKINMLDREYIAQSTREKRSLESVGSQMDRIFKQIKLLDKDGWYSEQPTDAVW